MNESPENPYQAPEDSNERKASPLAGFFRDRTVQLRLAGVIPIAYMSGYELLNNSRAGLALLYGGGAILIVAGIVQSYTHAAKRRAQGTQKQPG